MRIKEKSQMYALYQAGMFGNKLRSWSNLEDLKMSGYSGKVGMRYAGKSGGGFVRYALPQDQLKTVTEEWVKLGANPDLIRYGEDAPDEKLLIQGEVQQSIDYLDLFYSNIKGKMRDALKQGKSLNGLRAVRILKQSMSTNSWEDLQKLFSEYPGAVVEFSVYEMDLGCIPARNTLIWEVRHY